jgi:hypothetical protein
MISVELCTEEPAANADLNGSVVVIRYRILDVMYGKRGVGCP